MKYEGVISAGNREKLDKRPNLLQINEKIVHGNRKIEKINENVREEQENLQEKVYSTNL